MLTGANFPIHRRVAWRCPRYPYRLPPMPTRRASVLVAFAWIAGIPKAIKAGNVMIVPPPATEFMAPAPQAAANKISISMMVGTRRASARERRGKSGKIPAAGNSVPGGKARQAGDPFR